LLPKRHKGIPPLGRGSICLRSNVPENSPRRRRGRRDGSDMAAFLRALSVSAVESLSEASILNLDHYSSSPRAFPAAGRARTHRVDDIIPLFEFYDWLTRALV